MRWLSSWGSSAGNGVSDADPIIPLDQEIWGHRWDHPRYLGGYAPIIQVLELTE